MDLEGKTILITGSARRVGRAIALRLADAGPRLVLHYNRSRAEAESLADAVRARGAEAALVHGAFDSAAGVRAVIDAVRREAGHVDVLVNNASIFARVPLGEITEDHWDAQHMVNLKAPFLLAQAFGPEMRRRGAGKIVNIADVAGDNPWANYLAYSASKAGLINLTKGLAKALAPEVQVNAIGPGPIVFPEGSTEEERRGALRRTLLGREGGTREIAEAVWYLTAVTDFVTGAMLPVDGGRHIA